jgi:hypothetical protein
MKLRKILILISILNIFLHGITLLISNDVIHHKYRILNIVFAISSIFFCKRKNIIPECYYDIYIIFSIIVMFINIFWLIGLI